jgi:hypothetical protein
VLHFCFRRFSASFPTLNGQKFQRINLRRLGENSRWTAEAVAWPCWRSLFTDLPGYRSGHPSAASRALLRGGVASILLAMIVRAPVIGCPGYLEYVKVGVEERAARPSSSGTPSTSTTSRLCPAGAGSAPESTTSTS